MLDDVASLTMTSALAGLAQRQRITANNIANVETPGFMASKVDFESSLADAVQAGSPQSAHYSVGGTNDNPGINGNNVSLEREMTDATKTTLSEQLMANAITSKYSWITDVVKG